MNDWISQVLAWGQSAIDGDPLVFDSLGARSALFVAVREALEAKEAPEGKELRVFTREVTTSLTLVPLSGGLDSLVAFERARRLGETRAFYVALNTPYRDIEMRALHRIEPTTQLLNFSDWPERWVPYKTAWKHILPLRNLLIILAVARAAGDRPGMIWLGATAGEIPFKGGDKSLRFFDAVDTLLNTFPVKHMLEFPLRHETKSDLVAWWLREGLSVDRLLATVTCQAGTEIPCGACHACFNRWVAMTNNDLSEPLLTDPHTVEDNVRKVRLFSEALDAKDFEVWSESRIRQTLEAWGRS